jgi:hypothetical protein
VSSSLQTFPTDCTLETAEQKRRFELLRLAFFVLKLRKVEQRMEENGLGEERKQELAFRSNLLRHAIFQQVLTLIQLDAREQAMQIIDACRK